MSKSPLGITEWSTIEAVERVIAERNQALAEVARLNDALDREPDQVRWDSLTRERDEARAEVDRLVRMNERLRKEIACVEISCPTCAKLHAENASLRAEMTRLVLCPSCNEARVDANEAKASGGGK